MTETPPLTPAEFAHRYRIPILLVILVGVFMAVLDNNIVAIALPTITSDFNVPLGQSQWIATAYIITIIATVLIFGTLSPVLGKARLYICGMALFVASSAACGLAHTLPLLVLSRIVQGIGAAMLMSISMAIIMQVFPLHERGKALGYVTATVGLGLIIGPALGGVLVEALGWPYVFFVNVPIGIVMLIPAVRYLKLEETGSKIGKLDSPGIALFIALMAGVALFVNELANPPVNMTSLSAYAVFTLAALAAFVLRERSARNPLMDLSLFSDRRFVLPSASLVLYFVATFILIIILPFYFEGVMGWKPLQVGLVAFVMPVAMIVSAPVFGRTYDKRPSKNYPAIGVLGMGGGFFLCGYGFATQSVLVIVIALILAGLFRSIFQGPNTIEIMGSLPAEKAGIASSLLVILQDLGILLGISAGSILLVLQLNALGYTGAVLDAGAGMLPPIFANAMYAGGLCCVVAAMVTYKR
ncbi:major facilitator superfamily MFS_1 [Methanoregula boonei 6A8]|uniref:Major facilitator superfamily MFS_1 n=1 Tax=Methanoregula boonei (strain DSM 21154 / JCM 14090 / 6A8) TaxID=456442 RepID=A7I9X1_METB6|nr:MFS transporter [Methanoregula boonei]ABS56532.1 major facilitator superfamily MFS_1 [Methanoregula boonei 6A8]